MAEIVGLVAAGLSIAKLAQTAAKLATAMYKVAREAGSTGQRINGFSLQFESFDRDLRAANMSLEQWRTDIKDSPVMEYFRKNKIFESLERQSKSMREDMLAKIEGIRSIPSRFDIFNMITAFKWDRIESDMWHLHPKMESIKTSFMLISSIIIVEIVNTKSKGRPAEDYEQKIECLKRGIEEQIKSIQQLVRRNQLISVSIHPSSSSPRPHAARTDDSFRVICHLGQSYVETGVVPSEPPETFRFRDVKGRQRERRRHSRPNSGINPTRGPPMGESEGTRNRSQPTDPPTATVPSILHVTTNRGYTDEEHDGRTGAMHVGSFPEMKGDRVSGGLPRRRPNRQPSSVLAEEDKTSHARVAPKPAANNIEPTNLKEIPTDTPQDLTTPLRTEGSVRTARDSMGRDSTERRRLRRPPVDWIQTNPTPPQTPTSPAQVSATSAYPPQKHESSRSSVRRRTSPGGGGEISGPRLVTGYAVTKTGRHRFEAHVDHRVHGSLITREYANGLGLSVKEHPRQWISYADTELESVGKAVLDWSTRASSTLIEPRSIVCTVCEELPEHSLILGQWFSKAEKHMSRAEETEMED